MIPLSYYRAPDVLFLAQDLLGKYLFTHIDGVVTGGMIIETEAYAGPEDKASHAYGNRRTKRTEVMFQAGGVSYVYLIYGIHALLNIITHEEGTPHAVLIRAIKPEIGLEAMLKRRNKLLVDKTLTAGPGTLTQALGITTRHNGLPLIGPHIWLEDRGVKAEEILIGPRIGIDYAEEHALLPYRYRLK